MNVRIPFTPWKRLKYRYPERGFQGGTMLFPLKEGEWQFKARNVHSAKMLVAAGRFQPSTDITPNWEKVTFYAMTRERFDPIRTRTDTFWKENGDIVEVVVDLGRKGLSKKKLRKLFTQDKIRRAA